MTFCTKLSLVENLRITLNYLDGFISGYSRNKY